MANIKLNNFSFETLKEGKPLVCAGLKNTWQPFTVENRETGEELQIIRSQVGGIRKYSNEAYQRFDK